MSELEQAQHVNFIAQNLVFQSFYFSEQMAKVGSDISKLMQEVRSNYDKSPNAMQSEQNQLLLAQYDKLDAALSASKYKVLYMPSKVKVQVWKAVLSIDMPAVMFDELSEQVFPEYSHQAVLNNLHTHERHDLISRVNASPSPILNKVRSRLQNAPDEQKVALSKREVAEVINLNINSETRIKLNDSINTRFFNSVPKYSFSGVTEVQLLQMRDMHNFMLATSANSLTDPAKSKFFGKLPSDLVYLNIISFIAPTTFAGQKLQDYMLANQDSKSFASKNYALIANKPEPIKQPKASFSANAKYFFSEITRLRPEQTFLLIMTMYFASLLVLFGALELLWVPSLLVVAIFMSSMIAKNMFGISDKLHNFFVAKFSAAANIALSLVGAASLFVAIYFNVAALFVVTAAVGFLCVLRPALSMLIGLDEKSAKSFDEVAATQLPSSADILRGSAFARVDATSERSDSMVASSELVVAAAS